MPTPLSDGAVRSRAISCDVWASSLDVLRSDFREIADQLRDDLRQDLASFSFEFKQPRPLQLFQEPCCADRGCHLEQSPSSKQASDHPLTCLDGAPEVERDSDTPAPAPASSLGEISPGKDTCDDGNGAKISPTEACQQSPSRRSMASGKSAVLDHFVGSLQGSLTVRSRSERDFFHESHVGRSSFFNLAKDAVRSVAFQYLVSAMILLSGLSIGVETQMLAQSNTLKPPPSIAAVEVLFCVFFVAELCLRIYVFRCEFLSNEYWRWNLFDVAVVFLQVLELILERVHKSLGSALGTGLVGLVRYLRFIRILRLARAFRFVSELRTIVYSIVSSLRPLLWTGVLLLLMLFVTSVYFVQVVLMHRLGDEAIVIGADNGLQTFLSLPHAMMGMAMAALGGKDWDTLVVALMDEISVWHGMAFFVCIAVTELAMLNVITGVFVEAVIRRAHNEADAAAVENIRDMFRKVDVDNSGKICWRELSSSLNNQRVLKLFKTIGIECHDVNVLYALLDADGSGLIDVDEFLQGCLRLRSPAKAIDMLLMLQGLSVPREKPLDDCETPTLT